MGFQEYYKSKVRKKVNDPKKALALIKTGLSLYSKGISIVPDKRAPKSLQYLARVVVKFIHQPLKDSGNSALINLFTPSEILHSFGVYPLFGEAFSAVLRSFNLEDQYMDIAESRGANESMCGYHRTLYGAAQTGLLPKLKFVATTSMICDNNINTCRDIANKYGLPFHAMDVPYTETDESVNYLVGQLEELIKMVEDVMGKKFEMDKLKQIANRENQTVEYMNQLNDELVNKFMPNSLGLEMSKLLTSYVFMGSREANDFYKRALEDVKKCSPITSESPSGPEYSGRRGGKRILWVNILPSYHQVLDKYFSFSDKYQLIGSDFNLYPREKLNVEKPLESIARKMIRCIYNGAGEKKAKAVHELIKKYKPDAIIHFNHWGCKQANGGVGLIKEVAARENVPFLSLDGDAVDQRNSHQGQVRTRVGAFLEMLENNKQNTINN